jgi:hypothetical protein
MDKKDAHHFNQPARRKAEFCMPLNTLKRKVGSGGLSEEILNKAQALLEHNTIDFRPLAEMYLDTLSKGIEQARRASSTADTEYLIAGMLYPATQLKANGGMFHYPLVTQVGDKLVQYLEVISSVDLEVLEIVQAFHTTIRAILLGQVQGDGGKYGDELMQALVDACYRYFEKHPDNRDDGPYTTNEAF